MNDILIHKFVQDWVEDIRELTKQAPDSIEKVQRVIKKVKEQLNNRRSYIRKGIEK